MKAADFISLYRADGFIQTLAEGIRALAPKSTASKEDSSTIHVKGLHGSTDAVVLAAVYKSVRANHVVILHDKEEASIFINDLQNLLEEKEIFLFPMSYKRPYEYDEIENANVLMRAEVLNQLSSHPEGNIIITYPEALSEKVINKKSLASNTFIVQKGEQLDREFLEEFLHTYDFEKTDFVFEAGQFAIRGGIIDVFSFANELPFRIELFGNEVDGIRSFDPGSQLSVDVLERVSLMPNVQTRLVQEERQSIFDFISATSRVWIKDARLTADIVGKCFEKASQSFDRVVAEGGNVKVVMAPHQLFDPPTDFEERLAKFSKIEFGSRFHYPAAKTVEFKTSVQPAFNKNFELLAANLLEYQQQGFGNFIAAEQPKQAERLHGVFEEIHPELKFQTLSFSLRQGFVDHNLKVVCYTDHQIFERYHRYKSKEKFSKSKALTFRELQTMQPGDFVTHIDYGIGKFAGLEKKEVNGREQEAIRLIFRDDDILYVSIHALHKISKYSGKDGALPSISKLGSGEWDSKKAKVKKKVKDIAKELIDLYAKRKGAPGFAYAEDGFLQAELESSFIYEDTPDQAKATEDVKKDMQQPHPMDRLVCGDVGFGKTEVAIRAAFKAATEGKQVAVL
ncbi:MAG: CarD family transcriptional regulator, partial [Cyclobacteriaceae bacterium]